MPAGVVPGTTRVPRESPRVRRNAAAAGDTNVAATATVTGAGLVKQAADITALTDSSGGTSGGDTIAAIDATITDPADTPADADTLRDDLVANTIPDLESSIGEIADAVATLAAKLNTMRTNLRNAGIMV